jgi:FAD/FMN-containing dehydrogenase
MKTYSVLCALFLGRLAAAANSSFQNCIKSALKNNDDLYAFPGGLNILYEQTDAHPYNLDHPYKPAAVTYPQTAQQVGAVVVCARDAGVAVQARSGGHGFENYCLGGMDGALVVDTKNLNSFTYSAADGTCTFGSGNKLGAVTDQLQKVNRVMAYGSVDMNRMERPCSFLLDVR